MLRCVLLSWWEIDCNLNLHGSPTTTSINHKCGRKNYLMDGKFGELKVWEYCESGGRVAVLVGSFIMITSAGCSGARTHTVRSQVQGWLCTEHFEFCAWACVIHRSLSFYTHKFWLRSPFWLSPTWSNSLAWSDCLISAVTTIYYQPLDTILSALIKSDNFISF